MEMMFDMVRLLHAGLSCHRLRDAVSRLGRYRVNFGSDSMRREMDVPDTEIIDALPQ